MVLHEVEQLRDPKRRQIRLGSDLVEGRVATELLAERPPGALHAAHLVGDVHGKANRPALLGERPLHGLPDPPGRVRGELEAHRPVELVDRAHEPQIPLLDQVEERDVGARVVAGDRHHEPEVRLDEPPPRDLVALVLAACELALLDRRQEPAVPDCPHVELERVLDRLAGLDLFGRRVSSVEQWFSRILHERRIGASRPPLEAFLARPRQAEESDVEIRTPCSRTSEYGEKRAVRPSV